ncbi:glycosyltransferase family 4 protein [Demequina sediminicola]|uniref:glycosyltransferase family 4 protein n=1 Tax=Demequina sediminicola TaxID=1095026 RepID=UPI000785B575|nr:glycosyltransferase family 4 protein [Demequina sediminicola]
MRIAIVHSFYSSAQPSGENIVVELQRRALERAGHDVHLVATHTDDREHETAYALRSALRVATRHGQSPAEELAEITPDVVHLHNQFPNWGSGWISSWHQSPIVATLHNYRPLCAAGTLFRDGSDCTLCPTAGSHHAVKHQCYRGSRAASIPLAVASRGAGAHDPVLQRADALVALTSRAADTYQLLAHGGPDLPVTVVPNFCPDSVTQSEHSDNWVYVGRLSPEKGILELIAHWPADVPLTVIGSGPLLDQATTASAGKRIVFLGQVDSAEAQSRIARARGMAFPSVWREGIPTVYLESLAAGTPVLAWPGNSVSDDIEEAGTGVVVAPEDTTSGIARIMARHSTYSTAGRARFENRYTESSWIAAMARVYDKVTS